MVKAIRAHKTGGPEVLQFDDVTLPQPGPGEILIRNRAIGLNFIDVYQRTGLYKLPLPFVAGNEGAGEVMAVGAGATGPLEIRAVGQGTIRAIMLPACTP